MKNNMEMVSFILESDLNVPFKLKKHSGIYRLSEKNGLDKLTDGERWVVADKAILVDILLGEEKILKPGLLPSEKKIIREFIENHDIQDRVKYVTVGYSGAQPNLTHHLKIVYKMKDGEVLDKDAWTDYNWKTDERLVIHKIMSYPEHEKFESLKRNFEYILEDLRLWDDD